MKHTSEEKRKMRRERKKRKRRNKVEKLVTEKETVDVVYKNMSRSFWERWQWELVQHKEALKVSQIITSRSTPKREFVKTS